MEEGLEEIPIMVLQEAISILDYAGTGWRKEEEESLHSNGKSSPSYPIVRSYQPPIPFPRG